VSPTRSTSSPVDAWLPYDSRLKSLSLVVQAVLYVLAGRAHFTATEFYMKIMPPYLPWHRELVYLSGVAEIVLGLALLHPATRVPAAWGIMALLVAVFPANVHHLMADGAGTGVPTWALWARLPFQGVLLAWAYWHTHATSAMG